MSNSALNKKFNIVIPLGGLGKRFFDANYNSPKPLIKVLGKSIINWVIDCIPLNNLNHIIIPYNKILSNYNFEKKLTNEYPNINFLFYKLNSNTKGVIDTLEHCFRYIEDKYIDTFNIIKNQPVLCMDGDNFYTNDYISKWKFNNGVFIFKDYEPYEIYSYSKIEDDCITDIVEKRKISDNASTGIYTFETLNDLITYCSKTINNNKLHNGEYYMSILVKLMIDDGYKFNPYLVDKSSYKCLGTPIQIKTFCQNNLFMTPSKSYCFELFNTIIISRNSDNTFNINNKNREYIHKLKKLNNNITLNINIHDYKKYFTYTNNAELLNNIDKVLELLNIIYDEIVITDKKFDFVIDSSSIYSFENLERELGFYENNVACRKFNDISVKNNEFIKESNVTLEGEIYYYNNIPKKLEHLFPKLLDFDNVYYTFYKIEYINGINVGKLFLEEELTTNQFEKVLNSLNTIHLHTDNLMDDIGFTGDSGFNSHTCHSNSYGVKNNNIFKNYLPKLDVRYHNNLDIYKQYDYHEEIFTSIQNEIYDYVTRESKREYIKANMIHGDTVFSNILFDNNENIKFIDMRGKLGDVNSIYGDINYDYAKIYQSLLGYDEILNNKKVNPNYKKKMISYYEEYIVKKYDVSTLKDIKSITKQLLFTLIPLHYNDNPEQKKKCRKYYDLIFSI